MPNSPDLNSFEYFLQTWLVSQRDYVNQLRLLSSQDNQQEEEVANLVAEVLLHYKRYYETKSRVNDVFILFSPPWFSTFEKTFLWVAGFKPSLAFSVAERSVGSELTAHQVQEMKRLKARTRSMEKTLSDEMIRIQESTVGPSWVEIISRMEGLQVNGEIGGQAHGVIETTRSELKELVANADYLRTNTSRELVDILTPFQAARFLMAMGQLQLNIRSWGQQKDAERTSA